MAAALFFGFKRLCVHASRFDLHGTLSAWRRARVVDLMRSNMLKNKNFFARALRLFVTGLGDVYCYNEGTKLSILDMNRTREVAVTCGRLWYVHAVRPFELGLLCCWTLGKCGQHTRPLRNNDQRHKFSDKGSVRKRSCAQDMIAGDT